jgi:hypothetical protein
VHPLVVERGALVGDQDDVVRVEEVDVDLALRFERVS